MVPDPLLSADSVPHLTQQWVEGVLQLHRHALEGLAGGLAAQQLQRNGLVLAVHLTGRKLRKDNSRDMSRSTYCNNLGCASATVNRACTE